MILKILCSNSPTGRFTTREPPIALFALLDEALAEGTTFCTERGIALESVLDEENIFKNLSAFKNFADTLLQKDVWRKTFVIHENTISSLHEACKPEIFEQPRKMVYIFQYLREVLDAIIDRQDIDSVSLRISALLDESVVTAEEEAAQKGIAEAKPEFQVVQSGKQWNLSKVDVDVLEAEFRKSPYKHIEITDLRAFIEAKLEQMLQRNVTRSDFAERYQGIVDRYNSGGSTTEQYFEELMNFGKDLSAEEERHIREGLSESCCKCSKRILRRS